MKKKLHSLSAGLLAGVLLLILALPAAAADDTVYIRTVEDWARLARSCTLDTWSQGKTVVLEADLDLSGGVSIPTFGGVFDGGGHTISGLSLSGEGSHQGLFRYVQEGAVVRDLTVNGRVDPGGEWEALGGIAGVNRGTITGCAFQGVVRGGGSVGGIAGVNEASGEIVLCTAGGIVSGGYSTGGIAGENYGGIAQCTNQALVNTQEADVSPELDGIDWTDLNSTRNFPACTDSGGIAGYSKGSIQNCVNQGRVGYPHTGYNVGGIAGRQAGYLAGCVNGAAIQGRKDVGGIVGQMEPYTLLRYEETTLRQLADQLDVLSGLLDGTVDHTDGSRRQIADRVTSITGLTNDAQTSVFDLLDQVTGLMDGTVDTANDLTGRVAEVLDQASPVAGDLSRAADLLAGAMDTMDRALSHAGDAEPELAAAIREAQAAADSLSQAKAAGDQVLEQLRAALEGGQAPAEALRAALESLGAVTGQLQDAVNHLSEALPHLEAASKVPGSVLEKLRPALRDLESASSSLSRAMEQLEDLLETQAEKPVLEFPKLDSSFYDLEDQLSGTLSALTEAMEELNQNLSAGGDSLSGDLRQVNRQFRSITALLRDAAEEDERELVVDVSEEELSAATLGKAERCTNRGTVEGDLNVGGVVGTMAVEFDFDPEDDTVQMGSRSMNFQYLTSAVLLECVNQGTVTARKDCAGGVVGWMDLGIAAGCQGLGDVESTGGSYVGGVAGFSGSIIRGSWAKCALSGVSCVGGIAGSAADLTNCAAMVQVSEGSACVGAIAGDSTGTLSGNRFVSDTLGGVDGISYSGKAEPVTYEELLEIPGIPEAFSSLALTFTADGETVAVVPFVYGQALEASAVPEVPEREGFYGAWEPFDREHLTFDGVIEAVYTPWITALGSEDGQILAEGRFTPDAALRVQSAAVPLPETDRDTWGPWSVEASGGAAFTALRLACPEGAGRAVVRRWTERGGWEPVPATREGSYLRVELEGSSAVLCVTEAAADWLLPAGILAALALCGLCLYGLRRKRGAKHPPAARV